MKKAKPQVGGDDEQRHYRQRLSLLEYLKPEKDVQYCPFIQPFVHPAPLVPRDAAAQPGHPLFAFLLAKRSSSRLMIRCDVFPIRFFPIINAILN